MNVEDRERLDKILDSANEHELSEYDSSYLLELSVKKFRKLNNEIKIGYVKLDETRKLLQDIERNILLLEGERNAVASLLVEAQEHMDNALEGLTAKPERL